MGYTHMPIKGKAKKVLKSMKDQYGDKKGEQMFYATANKQGRTPETWEKTGAAKVLVSLLQKCAATNKALA